MKSQHEMIFDYLKIGNTITPLLALQKFGCFRLSDVIFKLKKKYKGEYDFPTKMIQEGKKHFAQYSLVKSWWGI